MVEIRFFILGAAQIMPFEPRATLQYSTRAQALVRLVQLKKGVQLDKIQLFASLKPIL